MYIEHSLKPIAVSMLAVCIGQVASDPASYPPVIYNRHCYNFPGADVGELGASGISAPILDCQKAIDQIATDSSYVTGATIGYLSVSTWGACSIMLSVPVTVRRSSLAAAAQDILSGCRSADPKHTAGLIYMFGFPTSADPNAPQGPEFTFTIAATGQALSNQKRAAASPDEASYPSRIHARDLLPNPDRSIILRRDPPTYSFGNGYTLRVIDSEGAGWSVEGFDSDTLADNLVNNMRAQPSTDFVAYATHNTIPRDTEPELQLAMGLYAHEGFDIGDIPDDFQTLLANGLNAFRRQQGSPGWFAVQVVSGATVVIASMFFDLALDAGPPVL